MLTATALMAASAQAADTTTTPNAQNNPFAVKPLEQGYNQAAQKAEKGTQKGEDSKKEEEKKDKSGQGKCGAGKCG